MVPTTITTAPETRARTILERLEPYTASIVLHVAGVIALVVFVPMEQPEPEPEIIEIEILSEREAPAPKKAPVVEPKPEPEPDPVAIE